MRDVHKKALSYSLHEGYTVTHAELFPPADPNCRPHRLRQAHIHPLHPLCIPPLSDDVKPG